MYQVVAKEDVAPGIFKLVVRAPLIVKKHRAGQFVILRLREECERIPISVADAKDGNLTMYIQVVGTSTYKLSKLKAGDYIQDVVGPLGRPTHIDKFGTVVCIGGGVGVPPVYPIGREMKKAGNNLISIIGARTKELLIMEKEMREISDQLIVTTDDGSYGIKGFVTDALQKLINEGTKIDLVVAIGPVIMMKAVCRLTANYNIKTIVSLNSIMVDGTGMCGACRVTIGGRTRFVCVDGPEFDGHQVDFNELMSRQAYYREEEKISYDYVLSLERSGK